MSEEDTFAQWLFYRFARDAHGYGAVKGDGGKAWNLLPEEDKLFWQHEADATRRAEKRGGFKHG